MHGVERAWLAAERLAAAGEAPPFLNQLVLEGHGALDARAWGEALERASAAWPGLSVRAAGWLHGAHWAAGAAPRLRQADGSPWDGQGSAGAPWLAERLDPWSGPVAEVLLLHGPTPRVAVRTQHAAVDGRGTLGFALDLTRALRGEPLAGGPLGPERDLDLRPPRSARPSRTSLVPGLLGTDGHAWPVTWQRARHAGACAGLLPRTLLALRAWMEASQGLGGERFLASIPVDLRPAGEPVACANLSGVAEVEVPAGASSAQLRAALDAALPEAGAILRVGEGLRGIPVALLAWFSRQGARRRVRSGRSDATVTVSNLGRVPLERLGGAGFTPTRNLWVPPGSPGNAAFLTMAGDSEGAELCLAAPAPPERIAEVLAHLVETLRAG
jgi:hypothetical protein